MIFSRTSLNPSKDDNAGSALAAQRVAFLYALRHRRLPDLTNPTRFTELVQLRKLNDRSPLQRLLMDKLAAKRLASEQVGADWIVPTLWQGEFLPHVIPFAVPSIVKARHGCNQYRIFETFPDCDSWEQIRRAARRWQRRDYGRWLDEWAYRNVPRGVLAEPLLGGARPLPVDYKIYVFGGVATHVQVHLGRGVRHRWILHDRSWRQLMPAADQPSPPASLGAMLEAAEALAGTMAFVRIDFYEIDGRPLFGECCLYPGSGLDPFAADWIDVELGSLWKEALARSGSPAAMPPEASPALPTRYDPLEV
ncbi:MAG: ATP-grasp fold amidoligase family protein [Sphingopyxis sp.]